MSAVTGEGAVSRSCGPPTASPPRWPSSTPASPPAESG